MKPDGASAFNQLIFSHGFHEKNQAVLMKYFQIILALVELDKSLEEAQTPMKFDYQEKTLALVLDKACE